jgi:hypothetical protein
MTPKKACIGIAAVIPLVGLTCVIIASVSILSAIRACVPFLDDLTGSPKMQPTGVAFFESTGGWDYRRIGLIEPYQAVSIDKETWRIDLETDSTRHQFSVAAEKLDVVDGRFIIVYSANTIFEGERVDELWFIIIPDQRIEKGFTEEEEFLTYLNGKGIDDPNLRDVNELYTELINKGYLEWFPEK